MLDGISPLYLLGSLGLGVVVPTVCGFVAAYYKSPEHLVRLGLRYQMHKAGMKVKYVQRDKARFCYGEKNIYRPDKPTLFFLHGFTASKIQWVPAFKGLRTDSHMVAMDLPGHGNSWMPDDDVNIDLDFIDSQLILFLDMIGLAGKKLHVVGQSLGGAMAGIFAALHPDIVVKCSMVCPAMFTPKDTDFALSLKRAMAKDPSEVTCDDCILIPQDIESLREMFEVCIHHKTMADISPRLYQGMLNDRLPKNDYFLKLYKATNTPEHLEMLAGLAPSLKMPTQLIWGKHDEIIHSSGAEHLRQKLPNCKYVDIFENCGHSIDIDRPGSLCKSLGKFIND